MRDKILQLMSLTRDNTDAVIETQFNNLAEAYGALGDDEKVAELRTALEPVMKENKPALEDLLITVHETNLNETEIDTLIIFFQGTTKNLCTRALAPAPANLNEEEARAL